MDTKVDPQKIYSVFVKKHRQATLLSLAATIITVVFFYWFVVTVTVPFWGNTMTILAIIVFLLSWIGNANSQDAFKSVKGARTYNPLNRKEVLLAKLVGTEKNTVLGILSEGVTAFTSGLNKKMVVVSSKLLFYLSPKQAVAITYHELGHQKNNDMAWLLLSSPVGVAVKTASRIAFFLAIWHFGAALFVGPTLVTLFGAEVTLSKAYVTIWAISKGSQILVSLLLNFASRQREIMADSYAVVNGYGQELIEGLVIISKLIDPKLERLPQGFFKKVKNLFQTHPLVIDRIRNIRNLMNGNEGLVDDTVEFWIAVIIMISGWFLGLQNLPTITMWSIFGVPGLYIAGPFFIVMVYLFITTPYGVENPHLKTMGESERKIASALLVLSGIVLIITTVGTGLGAIIWSAQVLQTGWIIPTILTGGLLILAVKEKTAMNKLLLNLIAIVVVIFIAAGIGAIFFII